MRNVIALIVASALGCLGLAAQEVGGKTLIVYFSLYGNQKSVLTDADSGASRTLYGGGIAGNTEVIARMIQDEVGGDLVPIRTKAAFSDTRSAVLGEGKHSKSTRFKETTTRVDMSGYRTVFIGFPSWWYDMPDPVHDFLEKHDLSGKKVYVFATSGGSGLLRAISDIQAAEPGADVCAEGFHVYYTGVTGAKGDVRSWLEKVGAK